jgi:hypothetical protein
VHRREIPPALPARARNHERKGYESESHGQFGTPRRRVAAGLGAVMDANLHPIGRLIRCNLNITTYVGESKPPT